MAIQTQLRRGTTSQHGSFTGAVAEVTVDTDKDTLKVHDGSTAGGHEITQNAATQTLTNKTLTSPDINTPDIDGGTIDGTVIGGATPAAGTFTDVVATGSGNRSVTITSSDALATMEIGGTTGAFIDIKTPSSDDYDLRLGGGATGGSIQIAAGTFTISGSAETMATFVDDGAVTLYHDNSAILATKSGGAEVNGDLSIASTVDSDGGDLGELNFYNRTNAGSQHGSSFINDICAVQGVMVGTGNNSGGCLAFHVKADGGARGEQVRINSAGLGIGTTAGTSALTVSGAVDASPGVAGFHAGLSGNYAATEYSGSDGGFIDFQDATDGNDHAGRIIYAHSDDSMRFSTAGAQRLHILSDGKVGIGTAAPGRLAHISAAAADTSVLRIEATGSHVAGVELLSGHGNWGVYNSDTVADALEFRDDSAGSTRMLINSSGNVGIGTTAPDSLVEIASGAATTAKVSTSATNSYAEWIFEDGNAGYGLQVRSDNAQSTGTGSFVINDRDTGTFPVVIKEGNATNTLVLSGSKLGINDSTPSQALSIGSSGSATPTYSHAADGEGLHFQYNDDSGARSGDIIVTGNTPAGATTKMRLWANTGSGDANAAAIMTLLGTGNVGINVSPSDPLHLYKAAADSTLRFQWDAGHAGKISFREGATETGRIEMHSPTDSDQAGNMLISTTSSGAAGKAIVFETNSAEAMRLLSGGNVAINQTSANEKLDVNGAVKARGVISANQVNSCAFGYQFDGWRSISWGPNDTTRGIYRLEQYEGDGGGGLLSQSASTAGVWSADYNDTSDRNLKKNIEPLSSSVDIVKALNPVSFDWKNEAKGSNSGFIAQELQEVLPNEVTGTEFDEDTEYPDTAMAINTTGIVAHLTKALQESMEKIDALEARIKTLEGDKI